MSAAERSDSTADPPIAALARRTVLRGAAVAGGAAAAGWVVAGCGAGATTSAAPGKGNGTPSPAAPPGSSATPSPTPGGRGGAVLGPTAQVPVGSGHIYPSEQVVVTQPKKGTFKGFVAICTHAGCPLSSVTDTINCICHGSQFALRDGSVVTGPATQPLVAKHVQVRGSDVVVS